MSFVLVSYKYICKEIHLCKTLFCLSLVFFIPNGTIWRKWRGEHKAYIQRYLSTTSKKGKVQKKKDVVLLGHENCLLSRTVKCPFFWRRLTHWHLTVVVFDHDMTVSLPKKGRKKKDEKAWKPSVQLLLHAVLLSFMGPSLYPVKDIQSLIDWKLKILRFLGPM